MYANYSYLRGLVLAIFRATITTAAANRYVVTWHSEVLLSCSS